MAHIVPLPHPTTRDTTHPDGSANDAFDVVVFLEHFKSIDSLSSQLMDHFEEPTDHQAEPETLPQENLVFQLPNAQLAMTLRAKTL